jgi:hypothetical protein
MRYGLHLWTDIVETTQPGDEYITSKPGRRHAGALIPIPVWLATWWCVVRGR